jgi:hypothetical protein
MPTSIVIGKPPVVSAAAAAVHSCSIHSASPEGSWTATAGHTSGVPVLQLWEGWALCQGLPPAKAGKLTLYNGTNGQPTEEPAKEPSAAIWPCQLHYRGGDTHGRGSLLGTFFLNEHPVIILFDSGASHDFISFTCAKRARLTLVASGVPYVISTLRG